jgi:predicted permease
MAGMQRWPCSETRQRISPLRLILKHWGAHGAQACQETKHLVGSAGLRATKIHSESRRRVMTAGFSRLLYVERERTAAAGLMILPESVLQDLRYGARMLSRDVGFTTVAVLALALGIGVNTAVFTAYKAMVARPLDARDPAELVNIAVTRQPGSKDPFSPGQSGANDFTFSYLDYEAYRDSVYSLSGVIAFSPQHMRLTNAGGVISQRVSAAGSAVGRLGLLSSGASNAEFAFVFVVSENYFKVLQVAPLRGRTFDSIGTPGLLASPSVLISENYWQKRFSGDPAILGKTVRLNGVALAVAGITPRDFVGTSVVVPDFWFPINLEPLVHGDTNWLRDRENQRYRLFGRLAAGFGIDQAQAEMTLVADHIRTLHDRHSESAKPATVLVWPGSPFPLPLRLYPGLRFTILLIMAAAGMVLAVACANVGSLQMARARARQNELHTRLSLGAGRLRIIRQLLTESALLALLAGILALFFTWVLLKAGVTLAGDALPADQGTLIFDVTPDLKIFAYVVSISLVAGILFGLAPAIESSRSALSSGTRGGTSSLRNRRLQDFLISLQVSLSLVLMIAGSLFIRSSMNALKMETGYDGKHVVDLDLQFPEQSQYTIPRKSALVRDLRTRLAAVPGVASITSARPPDDFAYRTAAVAVSRAKSTSPNVQSVISYTYIEPNYFQTLGIPLLLGRGFQPQAGQPERAVILSESAAKHLWPGQNPIGQSLRLGAVDERIHTVTDLFADGPAFLVIGVARDTRGVEFDGSDSRKIYLPLPDDRLHDRPILMRAKSDPAQLIRAIDPLVSSVDPGLVATSSTLDEMLRQTAPFISSSLAAAVASAVGLFGVLLASMGIYGTVSYIVVLRTREVGIRMAVGAQKSDIVGLVLRESIRPVFVGILGGMVLAVGTSYLLRGVLYGLKKVDTVSYAGVSLLFLAVALLAAYPPSRRALRVDPMVALRYE